MSFKTTSRAITAGFAALAVLAGVSITSSTAATTTTSSVLNQVIEKIPVKGRAPKTGYSRAQFGQAWADVNRNGCDTRNDILARDLTGIIFKVGTHNCVVLSGLLIDPYSGDLIHFLRGQATSGLVQIDHVVSLSNAWQTGAFKLTLDERTHLANDPLNLLAVKGVLNSQKSDGDAATWLPPLKSYRCAFVARQVAVKSRFKLWFTAAEKTMIVSILSKCPNQLLPK
ncbi:MAG: HNH endonuclease family protein [Actinobacteria bacterium]|nr:HNH endonuclease family protein [Actinomycetota bacterium]